MHLISRFLCGIPLVVLALVSEPRAADAQISFGEPTSIGSPLGLSLSGGISLGSYQAGVNFGLLELYRHAAWSDEFMRQTRIPRYRLRSVTGASAGNINTLLWAIEACTDVRGGARNYRSPPPDSSLFWNVWGNIGWNRIFNDTSSELAVFDRTGLIEKLARPILASRMRDPRLVEGCSVPAGITLTRVLPDTLRFQDLAIQTQRIVTPFQVTVDRRNARGDTLVRFGRIPVENDDQHFGLLAHLGPPEEDISFERLLLAVKASAAFPVAFAPVRLDLWYHGRGQAQSSVFLDGGAFDNNPVGFARNLYGQSGDSRQLDVLYVNPGRYRQELARRRGDTLAPPPAGGLASVTRFVGGAIPTARQYELQMLARERAHREREQRLLETIRALEVRTGVRAEAMPQATAVRERLLLSSRAYPVFGEHLGAFAAFLARPAREFDFNVGTYDALHMALWHHTCEGHGIDTVARQGCVRDRLPALIANPNLLRAPARHVATLLYNSEFPRHTLPVPPVSAEDRKRLLVQGALFSAMGTQFGRMDADSGCRDPRLIHKILCGDGLDSVLVTLRGNDEAVEVISEWARACGAEVCEAEPIFRDLVDDHLSAGTRLLDDVFDRLRNVERSMRNDTVADDDDYLRLITGLQLLFHGSHLRSRPQRDLFPSSVPTGSPLRAVPISYVGANLGTSGVEVRWQPTYNARSPFFFRVPVTYHYNAQPLFSDEEHYLGAGLSAGAYSSWIIASEFGLGVNHFRSAGAFWDGGTTATDLELHAVLLAGQLRASARWLPRGDERGRLHGRRGWAISAGLSDPIGLGFWLVRIFRGG
jgi:predicted acylesterase/phospholipase RssA